MSHVLSFTPKPTELTDWPVLICCCKLLQKLHNASSKSVIACSFPFSFVPYKQTGIWEIFVLAGNRNPTLWFPLRHQHLSVTGLIIRRKRDCSLCSLIYNGLTQKPCLAGTMRTILDLPEQRGICFVHSRGSVCCI